MKLYKTIKYIAASTLLACCGCTDLSETVYDTITGENYYQTKEDIISASVRPYEHAFWSLTTTMELQENTADQIATYNRQGDWLDGQKYFRLHYHTWTIDDIPVKNGWAANFTGIAQCNSAIDDISALNPVQFNCTPEEIKEIICGLRTMRAWFYIRLLDLYRNIPLSLSLKDQSQNSAGQVPPAQIFAFVEQELLQSIAELPVKPSAGGNQLLQGRWTRAGAAALLVRLYLNAEKWIGTPKYTECTTYAQKIINGEYGTYTVASRWDEPFDWNNETSDEIIMAFTSSYSRNHWQYDKDMYWWALPTKSPKYFGFSDWGDANPKFALQPGRDINGQVYPFELGKPVVKFQKYPEDVRLKLYKNLGNTKREGLFLFGYLDYKENGKMKRVAAPNGMYDLYIRDQVGWFNAADPAAVIDDKESDMNHADHNSGWHFVKYPIYKSDDPGKMESDYAEIRLTEIYYSLAECKFRAGDVQTAAQLLNLVRKRNYPSDKYNEYLYQPEGKVLLTENELIDEWGREFLGEVRRRTDLCRWNKFSTASWWDKTPDKDSHTDIFPLHRDILGADPALKQNPGYDDIERK